uniref:EF-hand domain-containing protein n=1 Tax=Ciona intestinalis TaxID=7719 RepID=F6XJA5_CIOIN
MKESYSKLDENNAGHISFEKLITSFPSQLSPCQMRFLHCLYDITTQNQLFGADEFIAMNNLSRSITKLSPSTQEMYEQLPFETLEESMTQYTELFSSVDRTARGRIGVGALLQILGTTLERHLEPDTSLAKQIMSTMNKDYDDDVPRLEFISYIPYFLYLEGMT